MKLPVRRALSLLLSLCLLLALAPYAYADVLPVVPTLTLSSSSISNMEVGSTPVTLTATITPSEGYTVEWSSSNTAVATVNNGTVTAVSPGEAKITATIKDSSPAVSAACDVTVSGISLASAAALNLLENEQQSLPSYTLYGAAAGQSTSWTSSNPGVARVNGGHVDALSVGSATLTLKAGISYSAAVNVTVRINQAQTIIADASPTRPLSFSSLQSQISSQCSSMTGSSLSYLTGVMVSTTEGTLYHNYKSPDETGAGVAQSANYFVSSAARGPYLTDITFVPNPYYTGERATIRYSGVGQNGRSFQGSISVGLEAVNNSVTLTATAGEPAVLSSHRLSQVCQQMTGSALSYVTFSLPAENRGTLYYDYVSDINYGAKVSTSAKYSLSDLDRVSFLPVPGYTGTVVVYYTGYSVSGVRYTGQISINVTQITGGGPVYNTGKGGVVSFSESDFYDYARTVTGQTLSYVQFSLPSSAQGTLYYDYSSTNNYGSQVSSGTNYYYSSRTPRISRVSFVPSASFTGTVTVPFVGWDTAGNRFNGTVTVNVRSGGSGNVQYVCAAGQSVKLVANDFNRLSQDLTGSGLQYITFHTLPDWRAGSIYYNRTTSNSGSLISQNTRYSYSYLSNLSFWAGSSFDGDVELSFTGQASNGDTFTGKLMIDIIDRGQQVLSYATDYRQARTFQVDDFNGLSRYLTNAQLNYVRFELPAASQGTLYYNYRSNGTYDSTVTASTNYYRDSYRYLAQVSFLPAAGFSGKASIKFTGWSNDGSQFTGVVEITVGAAKPEATVSYSTRSAPVTFRTADFERAYSRYQLTSLRFESLPPASAGHLYYQYASPTQYSWQASTGTDYWVSGTPPISSLTFVPKAGYTGTVTIPYTATNSNGTKYVGQVTILVEPTYSSAYFNDMAGYSSQALAAVDYLYQNDIVQGIGSGRYGPALSIQRGDFALMLYRAFRLYAPAQGTAFSDVPANSYYAQAIHTLRALGIVTGTGSNLFQPTGTITRQDAMLMVQRTLQAVNWAVGNGGSGNINAYADRNEISSYALSGMTYIVRLGLLPTNGARLAPLAPLTRVDMAQVLHRALTY